MSPATATVPEQTSLLNQALRFLPRGNMLDDVEWRRRHHLLLWVLALHVPALAVFGLLRGWSPAAVGPLVGLLAALAVGGYLCPQRRLASVLVTAGLTSSSMVLVIFSGGSIEAHFHFFIIVGFLALYQDWIPFLWNIAFTVISHGVGSAFFPTLIFNHLSAQGDPWLWSLIHGASVLAACAGVVIFWRFNEDVQAQRAVLIERLAHAEIEKQEFTSDLLLNLARRNQSMFHRQLDIINDLEERERDPDALAELFRLDHLATRVRRNAESLLVLSGEQPARVWSAPVPLRDVVRAAIAETEDLERVLFTVDEGLALIGSAVADLTHLLAELAENAVRYSPPTSPVSVTSRPYHPEPGTYMIVIEDTGVGMPADDVAVANEFLAAPGEVDVSASRRLGFHVVSRLAARHDIRVSLTPTPGCGLTAVVILPAALFAARPAPGSTSVVPSVLAAPHGERLSAPRPETFSASRLTSTPSMRPQTDDGGTSTLNGRHSWPGVPASRDPAVPAQDDREHRDEHARHGQPDQLPVVDEPRVLDTPRTLDGTRVVDGAGVVDGAAVLDEPAVVAQERPGILIHPVVVPAPRELGEDGSSPARPARPTPTPTPRESPEDQGSGRTLNRRVPQTHLAPELVRAAPSPERAEPPRASGAAHGPLDALSRYQASRRAARMEIDDSDDQTSGKGNH